MATVERLGFGAGESATGKRAMASAVASFCANAAAADDFCLDVGGRLPSEARGRAVRLPAAKWSSYEAKGPPLSASPTSVEVDLFLTDFG